MNSRKLAGASAASIGAATAVAALLLGTLSGNAGEGDPRSSAYGLSAKGLLPIAPTPYVEAPPDGTKALLELPSPVGVALLKVEAEAFRSKATAVKVEDLLGIKAALIEARCDHGHGEVSIIGGTGNGKVLPSSPSKGQELDLSPILKIQFDRQHRDGDKLTVDAVVVSLLPADNAAKAVAANDLTGLQELAPNLTVPTMKQLEAEHAKSASQQPKSASQQPESVSQQPESASQQPESAPEQPSTAPNVADLVSQLKALNPGLATKGDGDALLEIVISSASCSDERKEAPPKEAPAPKPVEADLPVTH
ncbi:MAG TPA: hypothetical protein VK887_06085 [Pseudonocardiaceae bacterium]|nr:hypothetical protein [Pseudonocardiaceae bacterium]